MNKQLTDDDLMPYGKHNDLKMKDVPADYLLWLADSVWWKGAFPEVVEYVNRCQKDLERDVARKGRE